MDKSSIDNSKLIFTGEVINIVDKQHDSDFHSKSTYHFKVIKAFKGTKRGDIIKVTSSRMSVGIHARIGQKWLIVPHHDSRVGWTTNVCTYSGKLSDPTPKKNFRFLKKHYR